MKYPDSMYSNDLLSVLQKPRAIVTILYLYHAKNQGLDMLLEKIGGSKRTGMARINDFYRIGIVTKRTEEYGRKTFYVLSTEGQVIAQKLEDIVSHWVTKKVFPGGRGK